MSELALPEPEVGPEPEPIPMDSYVDKLTEYKECQRMIKFWRARLEAIQEELTKAMGDAEVGLIDGKPAIYYKKKNAFRGKDFAALYPDTYRLFTRDVVHKEFDLEWFKKVRPEQFEEFKVRSMRIEWEE
jgi:hypothetical protein